jgi:hypothetical protein
VEGTHYYEMRKVARKRDCSDMSRGLRGRVPRLLIHETMDRSNCGSARLKGWCGSVPS